MKKLGVNSMKKISHALIENVALLGLAIVMIIGIFVNSRFLSFENLSNVMRSASINGFIAIGITFVIICGSIDLSVASMFALSGYLFIVSSSISPVLTILFPVCACIIIGVCNGYIVGVLHIPAFVGTLASSLLVNGLVLIFTKETTIKAATSLDGFFTFLGRGTILYYLPFPSILFIAITVGSAFLLKRIPFGRSLYALGSNKEAARMMGINTNKTIIYAHIICGAMAGIAGLLHASRVGSAHPLAGSSYELYAIAAAVIGGAKLSGGVGKMSGTFIGVIIMGLFNNIFNMQQFLNAVWEHTVVGIVLLLVVFVQAITVMRSKAALNV